MEERNIYKIIGNNIKRERFNKNLTIEELAEKANISPSFLSYIENGKKKASISTLHRIAKALDCELSELLEEKRIEEKKNEIKLFFSLLKIAKNINKNKNIKDI